MLVDESKYIWQKWQQPIFESNTTWGEVSATSSNEATAVKHPPFHALDGSVDTHWEGEDYVTNAQYMWVFEKPLRIYRIELVNKPSSGSNVTKNVELYADEEMTELLLAGEFPETSKSVCVLDPELPIACDRIVLNLTAGSRSQYVGLTEIRIVAEIGTLKVVLEPYLNTTDGMDYISNGYNDDNTYSTTGLEGFMFNGIAASTIYISSNHWFGFGTNSEQLKVCRRDGCSTAIFRQLIECDSGLQILKIRFEGYTVYNNRVESNRLIIELFLISNNDMFLNVIQTPTSGNNGESSLICNGTTTSLNLNVGSPDGAMVSFYHLDENGYQWDIRYEMYSQAGGGTQLYLLRLEDTFYSVSEGVLVPLDVTVLNALAFMMYGFEEKPSAELLTPLANPQVYFWQSGTETIPIKAVLKAYPYPQILDTVADMSHITILGIKLLTAEYSGDVGVSYSLDDGQSYCEELPLLDFLNTDRVVLWENLPESKRLYLHFILHDNATLSRFKITYEN